MLKEIKNVYGEEVIIDTDEDVMVYDVIGDRVVMVIEDNLLTKIYNMLFSNKYFTILYGDKIEVINCSCLRFATRDMLNENNLIKG